MQFIGVIQLVEQVTLMIIPTISSHLSPDLNLSDNNSKVSASEQNAAAYVIEHEMGPREAFPEPGMPLCSGAVHIGLGSGKRLDS